MNMPQKQPDFRFSTDEILGILLKKEKQIHVLEQSLEAARKRIDELNREKVEKQPDEA